MKIIENGKFPVLWWDDRITYCTNCNTKIQLEDSDKPVKHDGIGRTYEQAEFECPVCKCTMLESRFRYMG